MAVFTPITETEIAQLESDYPIGKVHSFTGIIEGIQNSNFHIHSDSGRYILTLFEQDNVIADLPFFLALMTHLAAHGFSSPQPIARQDGALLSELAGRPAALVSFLSGTGLSNIKPHHCYAFGKQMAALHHIGLQFDKIRENDLSQKYWAAMFAPLKQNANQIAADITPDIATEISSQLAYLSAHWPSDLPRGIIHGDLFPDNVFFQGQDVAGIIDFYFACTDFLAYDIAISLNSWCFEDDHNFNVSKAQNLLAGYQSVRPLREAELAALPILARGAAMRFLLTRLHDWLHGDENALIHPKPPLEYLRRLRFHNNTHQPADYGIIK